MVTAQTYAIRHDMVFSILREREREREREASENHITAAKKNEVSG